MLGVGPVTHTSVTSLRVVFGLSPLAPFARFVSAACFHPASAAQSDKVVKEALTMLGTGFWE